MRKRQNAERERNERNPATIESMGRIVTQANIALNQWHPRRGEFSRRLPITFTNNVLVEQIQLTNFMDDGYNGKSKGLNFRVVGKNPFAPEYDVTINPFQGDLSLHITEVTLGKRVGKWFEERNLDYFNKRRRVDPLEIDEYADIINGEHSSNRREPREIYLDFKKNGKLIRAWDPRFISVENAPAPNLRQWQRAFDLIDQAWDKLIPALQNQGLNIIPPQQTIQSADGSHALVGPETLPSVSSPIETTIRDVLEASNVGSSVKANIVSYLLKLGHDVSTMQTIDEAVIHFARNAHIELPDTTEQAMPLDPNSPEITHATHAVLQWIADFIGRYERIPTPDDPVAWSEYMNIVFNAMPKTASEVSGDMIMALPTESNLDQDTVFIVISGGSIRNAQDRRTRGTGPIQTLMDDQPNLISVLAISYNDGQLHIERRANATDENYQIAEMLAALSTESAGLHIPLTISPLDSRWSEILANVISLNARMLAVQKPSDN